MAKCSQCGKPAVVETGGHPLCVDCYAKFQSAMANQQQQLAALLNYLTGEMEATVGLPGLFPRLQMPESPSPVLHHGPITFHHINVDRSIIGAVNTGEVQKIDVSLSHLHNLGNDAAIDAFRTLTEAVLADDSLNTATKNELLEQISFLSTQAMAGPQDRKPGLIKSIVQGLRQSAQTTTAVADAWVKAEPILKSLFGL